MAPLRQVKKLPWRKGSSGQSASSDGFWSPPAFLLLSSGGWYGKEKTLIMKPASAKAKGRALQNWIVEQLQKTFYTLDPDDIKPAIMGESGADIKLSPAARKEIPYKFEAKNQERVNVWAAYEQAQGHKGSGTAVVIIKKNHHSPLAIIDAKYFFNLMGYKN
jgi:hypothetical protein